MANKDDLLEYIRAGEPHQRQRAENWRVAIGLQKVDGLETSEYLVDAARRNIEGEISLAEVKGFKVAFAGRRRYQNRVQLSSSPEEEKYYWLRGIPAEHEELEGSDVRAVNSGFVAVTFLQHDTTDYELNKLVDPKIVDKIKLK